MLQVAIAMVLAGLPVRDEPRATWVFFVDKGVGADELDDALARRRDELSPRALARRQRARRDDGVDARDLPIATTHLEAVRSTGARVRAHSRWLNAVSVDADAVTRERIAALPIVRALQPVVSVHRELPITGVAPSDPGPAPEGIAFAQLDQIGATTLYQCGLTGDGVLVGVLDTGFQLDHVAFAELDVVAQHDFLNDDDVVGYEVGDADGQYFHGSWVLSALAGRDDGNYRGAAPGISVLLAKTEDYAGEYQAEEDYFVAGLEWIESMGADMSTASLGYYAWYTPDQYDGQTAVTTIAANAAIANGLVMFQAMGNFGPGPTSLIVPADADGLVSVGAVDSTGVVTGFSSRGPTADGRTKPDVCGDGQDVYVVDLATIDQYTVVSGTSIATPLVAGVGALLLEAYPGLTPAQMVDLLHSTASQSAAPDNDYGWGIVGGAAAGADHCTCILDPDDPSCASDTGTSSGSSTGEGTSTGESTGAMGSSSSGADETTTSVGESTTAGGTTTTTTSTSGAASEESSSSAGSDDATDGCGCTGAPSVPRWAWLALFIALPRRRHSVRMPAPSAMRATNAPIANMGPSTSTHENV
jgi:subtilisin family serine protease